MCAEIQEAAHTLPVLSRPLRLESRSPHRLHPHPLLILPVLIEPCLLPKHFSFDFQLRLAVAVQHQLRRRIAIAKVGQTLLHLHLLIRP